MKKKRLCLAVATVVLLASVACGLSSGAGDYQALVDLNDEFLEFRRPAMTNGLPDYRNETIESQRAGLESFAQRLQAIDPTSWPVSQQVDYLLVRAQINRLDFDHRARRRWSRDPGLYVDTVQRLAFQEFPLEGEKLAELETQLGGVPAFLAQAEDNLTDGAGELTMLALRNLVTADGVGHGHPYREVPPAGAIAWYEDLGEQLEKHHSELAPKAKEAQGGGRRIPPLAQSESRPDDRAFRSRPGELRLVPEVRSHDALHLGRREPNWRSRAPSVLDLPGARKKQEPESASARAGEECRGLRPAYSRSG